MTRPSVRERLRYRFDSFMSRGTPALVGGLALVSLSIVLAVATFVAVTGAARSREPGVGFPTLLWRSLMRTLDPGTMGGDEGTALYLASMLAVTLGGIFVISALIGVLSTGLEARLAQLRKGRSRVLEHGHTVVLGWSQAALTVLSELVVANANQRRSCVVVLADRDKVEMEEEIAAKLPDCGRTRIVVRHGSPMDQRDIDIASVQTSRSIVVLAPEVGDPDAQVIKTLLAIINDPDRRPDPYHVVVQLHEAANIEVARMIAGNEVEVVDGDSVIARITAQACRQSGLSSVYAELLDFAGDEIYVAPVQGLQGRTFADALLAFEDAAVIGLLSDGRPLLNPPMDSAIKADDRVIAIAPDDDRIRTSPRPPQIHTNAIREATPVAGAPERTLLLGWNRRASAILRELDGYVAPGSECLVVSAVPADGQREPLTNTALSVREADTTDRRVLDALDAPSFDHVIVLCYSEALESQQADARTLVTLLHLRDIASKSQGTFSLVSEMMDVRNRDLAEAARADDFIVSNRLVSLLVTQISENKHLGAIFRDLFDEQGAEIYLKPAADYVATGSPVNFATIVHAALIRGEVAIGLRHASAASDSARHYGVSLNPPKGAEVTLSEDDRVIVLSNT
ncbi:MAG TPA: potassium transporter TrkA [Actinomycetota bacterium]|nr:potassium transporter TrkA [Actinomycetota bacterium]